MHLTLLSGLHFGGATVNFKLQWLRRGKICHVKLLNTKIYRQRSLKTAAGRKSRNRKCEVYWLPLGVVAVHAAVVGLSAGLPAHVPRQLHRHAGLRAPLDGRTLLLLTLHFWTAERKHNVPVWLVYHTQRCGNADSCWFRREHVRWLENSTDAHRISEHFKNSANLLLYSEVKLNCSHLSSSLPKGTVW